MTSSFPNLPVPSATTVTSTFGTGGSDQTSSQDLELLYSTAGFTQKGCTIAAGQGILPIGCVLGRKTSDKKYYVYNNSASDGTQVARGVLRRAVNTAAGDQLANIVIQGILKNDLVSGADSGALTDLGAVVDSVRGTFKF